MSTEASGRAPLMGAWEAVLDHASLKVATYLASSNTPFDSGTALAKSMLCLLDHHTLRDIVAERNVSGLCGRFGCPRQPRGIALLRQKQLEARGQPADDDDDNNNNNNAHGEHAAGVDGASSAWAATRVLSEAEMVYMARMPRAGAGTRPAIISSSPDACSCSDLDDEADDDERADDALEDGEDTAVMDPADPEELVYDHDYFTLESFRMARRQEQQLTRLRHRAERARLQRGRTGQTGDDSTPGASPAGRRGRRHLHADLWERFCCVECEDHYRHALLTAVHHVRTYDHVAMQHAITHLFPTLRPDVVRQLADADVPSRPNGAPPLVASTVSEANDIASVRDPQRLAPVRTGIDYEVAPDVTATGGTTASGSVADVMREMHMLGKVWGAELAMGSAARPAARADAAAITAADSTHRQAAAKRAPDDDDADGGEDAEGHEEADEDDLGATGALVNPLSTTLSGPLLVLDFLTSAAGETTHYLFFYYYCLHRDGLLRRLAADPPSATAAAPACVLRAVVRPVLAALERKARALFPLPETAATPSCVPESTPDRADRAAAAWKHLLGVRAAEVLRVNPLQQQPRRELFAGRYLSGETASAVARLLLVDPRILFDGVWHGLWMRAVSAEVVVGTASLASTASGLTLADAHAALTLAHSLRFWSAIPSTLLQPIGASRESLMLALGLVLSALCVSDSARLWRELELSDREGALSEIMEAIDVSLDDMTAIVMALVLGAEGV